MEIFYPAMATVGAAPSEKQRFAWSKGSTGGSAPATAIAGENFHKNAKITEKKYLLSRWGLFSWLTGKNKTFDCKIIQKLEFQGKYF